MSEEWCYEDSIGEDGDGECPTGGWLTGNPTFVTCKLCIGRFNLRSDDADFRQRMHFMGPQGFGPCTRPWPHEGPCAHPPGSNMVPMAVGRRGLWIALDWYDGPIIEIARITYEDEPKTLVEVRSFGWQDPDETGKIRVRFDRDELVKMLDLLDGKPVLSWKDELEGP